MTNDKGTSWISRTYASFQPTGSAPLTEAGKKSLWIVVALAVFLTLIVVISNGGR